MKKQSLIRIILGIIMCISVLTVFIPKASADDPVQLVVIGDDITAADNIKNPEKDAYWGIVGNYFGSNVEITRHASDGYKVEDLLQYIQSNSDVQNSLKNADYVIVTIGENNIIKPSFEIIEEYGGSNSDFLDTLNNFDTSKIDKGKLSDEMADKVATITLRKNLYALVDETQNYPNAKFIFTNAYNSLDMDLSGLNATQTRRLEKINDTDTGLGKYYEFINRHLNSRISNYSNCSLLDILNPFAGYGDSLTNILQKDYRLNEAGQLVLGAKAIEALKNFGLNGNKTDIIREDFENLSEKQKLAIKKMPEFALLQEYGNNVTQYTTSAATTSTTTTNTSQITSQTVQSSNTIISTAESQTSLSTVTTTTQIKENPTKKDHHLGDIDGDGEVTAKDATRILVSYANSIAGYDDKLDLLVADVNDDGNIDAKDATVILVKYAQAIAEGRRLAYI